MDLQAEFLNIERYLFPRFEADPWERTMYYHLLINTRLSGVDQPLFAIDALSRATKMNHNKVRETIRSMDQKGSIRIVEKNRNGHLIKAFFPSEIEGLVTESDHPELQINIEELDFYKGRRYLTSLLERDGNRCIYCLKHLTSEKSVLDHIVSLAKAGDNSYRNIAVSCHDCNSKKGETDSVEFVRALYRSDVLTEAEFQERKDYIQKVRSGTVKPRVANQAL
jgi:hypothetical protein